MLNLNLVSNYKTMRSQTMMLKIIPFVLVSIIYYSCATKDMIIGEFKHKRMRTPILREGVVVIPYIVKLRTFTDVPMQISEMRYRDFQNKYRNMSLQNSYNFYKLVMGEKYIILIDSFGPVSSHYSTDNQEGPFFYKDEHVDTTLGKISKIKYFKSEGRFDVSYTYEVNNKKYVKGFSCLDTFLFTHGAYVGSTYKVIYDPKNIGRARLLYEPDEFIFKHPKTKN